MYPDESRDTPVKHDAVPLSGDGSCFGLSVDVNDVV